MLDKMHTVESKEILWKEGKMIQERLVDYINGLGVKQIAIAQACGMTPQAVSESMRCERRFTIEEYAAICRFLGVSMDDFKSA